MAYKIRMTAPKSPIEGWKGRVSVGMLTGVNVHTQEWRDAITRALILVDGDARSWCL